MTRNEIMGLAAGFLTPLAACASPQDASFDTGLGLAAAEAQGEGLPLVAAFQELGIHAGSGHEVCGPVEGGSICTRDPDELLSEIDPELVSSRRYCILYEHIKGEGRAAVIDFDVPDLRSLYGWNWEDQISGVMCSLAGAQLWEHRYYARHGVRKTFYWDRNLVNDGWNDRASSIRFRGR